MKKIVKIKKLNKNAMMPTKGSQFSAGFDLYACIEKPVEINPNETIKIPTGLAIELPIGYAGFIFARSGISTKKNLAPANKVGVCDCDYRGEYIVPLHNHGKTIQKINPNDRIAQLVILPYLNASFVETKEELKKTSRGKNGFGSTGT